MRNFLNKAIKILDGTPRPKGKVERQKGQSVVEMTMITPLLIILLVGLVEIGWFARNYLTLLEVTRVGARRGAVLSGDNSPFVWNEWASLPEDISLDPYMDDYPLLPDFAVINGVTREEIERRREYVRDCRWFGSPNPPAEFQIGFYNLVLCQMKNSLDPLVIRKDDALPLESRTDDIIISVFAIQMVHNNIPTVDGNELRLGNTLVPNEFQDGYMPVVVGRYPTKANECNMWLDATNTPVLYTAERDPFDFYGQRRNQNDSSTNLGFLANSSLLPNPAQFNYYNSFWVDPFNTPAQFGGVDVVEVYRDDGGTSVPVGQYPLELAVMRDGVWVSPGDLPAFDPYNYREMVRGFAYTGYHRVGKDVTTTQDVNGTPTEMVFRCYGSEFSVYEVQRLLSNNNFLLSPAEITEARQSMPNFGRICDVNGNNCVDEDLRSYLPNQGVVLVEVFWQHRLLLDIPVFSPVYNALGSDRTTIQVWSAFPAPTVSPNLKFNLDVGDFGVVTP